MQTFLPYQNFEESAQVLDYRRLGKQRVETKQILNILLELTDKKGWRNHPAVKMWRGHEMALALYGETMCREWISRGYNDSLLPWFLYVINRMHIVKCQPMTAPEWNSDEKFHASHRAALLAKAPEWYSQFGWSEKPEINYIWPVVEEQ